MSRGACTVAFVLLFGLVSLALLVAAYRSSTARIVYAQAATATPTCAWVTLRTPTPVPAGTATATASPVPYCTQSYPGPPPGIYDGGTLNAYQVPAWRADCNNSEGVSSADAQFCLVAFQNGLSGNVPTPSPTSTPADTPTPGNCFAWVAGAYVACTATATAAGTNTAVSATATETPGPATNTPTITPTSTPIGSPTVTQEQAAQLVEGAQATVYLLALVAASCVASLLATIGLYFLKGRSR